MKLYRVLAILGCLALVIGIPAYAQSLRPAANGVNDSTYVGYGQTVTITAADGSCEIIHNQNPTGNTIFVPGKYIEEWDWFSQNLQQGVTVSACGGTNSPPPGCQDIGHCAGNSPNANQGLQQNQQNQQTDGDDDDGGDGGDGGDGSGGHSGDG